MHNKFESTVPKESSRVHLLEIIQQKVETKTPVGACLCGEHAIFENKISTIFPSGHTICVERNPKIFKIAEKHIPDNAEIHKGDWQELSKFAPRQFFDWMWADFCATPLPQLVNACINDINIRRPTVYAMTFSLLCRTSKFGGGAENFIHELISDNGDIAHVKEGVEGLIQAISKKVYSETGLLPHKGIFYRGGTRKKGVTPMICLIYLPYESNGIFSWNYTIGNKRGIFVDLYNQPKKGKRGKSHATDLVIGKGGKAVSKKRSEACQRAWIKIRAKRLAKV